MGTNIVCVQGNVYLTPIKDVKAYEELTVDYNQVDKLMGDRNRLYDEARL